MSAIRAGQFGDEKAAEGQPPFGWLTLGPAVLTAAGVLLYGILNISYSLFYGTLGVNPEDVGLTYVTTLTRSTGFVLFVVVIIVFGVAPAVGIRMMNRRLVQYENTRMSELEGQKDRLAERERATLLRHRQSPAVVEELQSEIADERKRLDDELAKRRNDVEQMMRRRAGRGTVMAIGIVATLLLVLAAAIPLLAYPKAGLVRDGREVSPMRVAGLTVLAISADRSIIRPTGKPSDTAAISELNSAQLLYLGQSGGTHVFYDGVAKQAIYLPTTSAIVKVDNSD